MHILSPTRKRKVICAKKVGKKLYSKSHCGVVIPNMACFLEDKPLLSSKKQAMLGMNRGKQFRIRSHKRQYKLLD